MRQTCFKIVVLIVLISQCLSDLPPIVTPAVWTQNAYTFACQAIGAPKIVQTQNSAVLLGTDYIYLTTSRVFFTSIDENGNKLYTQKIFKYHIELEAYGDGFATYLKISMIQGIDGQKFTQSIMVRGDYVFLGANGPFCVLKQLNFNFNPAHQNLNLYSFDFSNGATSLLQLSSIDLSVQYTNEIFKSLTIIPMSQADGNFFTDSNYANIVATLVTINTVSSEAVIRKIISSGIDSSIYSFQMNDVSSDIYTNLLFALEISGTNFYTYVCEAYNSGTPLPYSYANDNGAISTASGLYYSNHIVIINIQSMMVATYDDAGSNGNIFFLVSDQMTYGLSLFNMKTTMGAQPESLQYLTDQSSYIIEVNLDPVVSSFYIVWVDNVRMHNYTYLNSLGDNNNVQIIQDFSNQPKISAFIYGQWLPDGSYGSSLFIWVYKSTSIAKYILYAAVSDDGNVQSITLNKEFDVVLADNLLVNSIGTAFQVNTQLKCVCQVTQVTDMVCFYGNDACTFTVQTLPQYCVPQIIIPG